MDEPWGYDEKGGTCKAAPAKLVGPGYGCGHKAKGWIIPEGKQRKVRACGNHIHGRKMKEQARQRREEAWMRCTSAFEHVYLGDPYSAPIKEGQLCACGLTTLTPQLLSVIDEQTHMRHFEGYHSLRVKTEIV